MASTIYTGTTSQTTAYAASDVYTLAVPTSSITNVSQQGSNVVISTGATSLTITGVTLAQLANANFALQGGGFVQFGDGTSDTVSDQFGQTIAQGANNNGGLVLGLGGGDTITLGNGANLIYGGSGVTDPTDGGDTIQTGTGNDTIYGNGGNDNINSGGGTDIVYGGIGNDTIVTGALTGNVSVYGGGGFTDTTDGADSITIASNSGNLFATGNAGNDTITLTASTGSASIYGGIGADTITAAVSAGNNLFAGGSATGTTDVDTINITASGTANVTVYGGVGITDTVDGADSITVTGLAAGSNAFIYGNAGNDTISVGTAGTASVYGGVGTDSITLTTGATTARVQVFAGAADGTGADTVDASAFTGNATIFGGNGLNDSADGADRLLGGSGNDVIYGNGGNDTIFSGGGNDQLSGGVGNDTFVIDSTGNKAITDFGTGSDSLFLNLGAGNVLTSVTASSTGAAISLNGGATNVSVAGTIQPVFTAVLERTGGTLGVSDNNDGVLQVATTSASANLTGGANNDFLQGNAGADNITGGAGVDTIIGGTGADILSGGAGADVFRFVAGDSGTPSGTNFDTITDYTTDAAAANRDVIDFAVDLTFQAGGSAAAAGQGSIAANGLVTFNAADTTLAQRIAATESAIQVGGNTSGETAIFTQGADSYVFVSDGVNGVGSGDVLIKLTGITATGGAIATGDLTITV